jgi:hypothetical protein
MRPTARRVVNEATKGHAMHDGTGDLRKRLASWVAEKISSKRYASVADANISALQEQLFARRAWTQVACWCESCDTAANNGLRTRMSVCPECGDKRCPKAAHHGNDCSKTPNV